MCDLKTNDLKKIVDKGYISCFHSQYVMCDTKTYDLKLTRVINVVGILFEYHTRCLKAIAILFV